MIVAVIVLSLTCVFLLLAVAPAAYEAGRRRAQVDRRAANRARTARVARHGAGYPAGFGQVEDSAGNPVAP